MRPAAPHWPASRAALHWVSVRYGRAAASSLGTRTGSRAWIDGRPGQGSSKCFEGYRLSATMPMTRTVSIPQRLPTVRTRPTNWIAVLAIGLMSFGGWVAKADAASAHRTRAKSTTARKGTAVKARPRAVKDRKHATRVRAVSSRRSRLARARAARTQWLEAQTPRYKTDASGALVPDVRAAAAIIYNPENGQVLWEAELARTSARLPASRR